MFFLFYQIIVSNETCAQLRYESIRKSGWN